LSLNGFLILQRCFTFGKQRIAKIIFRLFVTHFDSVLSFYFETLIPGQMRIANQVSLSNYCRCCCYWKRCSCKRRCCCSCKRRCCCCFNCSTYICMPLINFAIHCYHSQVKKQNTQICKSHN
jgi:hypothetical protein